MPGENTTRSSRRNRAFNQKVRQRIRASKIVSELQRFVLGEIEMSNGQVAAAKILLDRVLPALTPLDANALEGGKEMLPPQLVIHVGSTEIPKQPGKLEHSV